MRYRVPPLWPTYTGERWTTFAKAYVIKVRCYGEHVEEHIGNLKGKKARHLECMLGPSHWGHEISFIKRFCHHFWHGQIPLAKNIVPIHASVN